MSDEVMGQVNEEEKRYGIVILCHRSVTNDLLNQLVKTGENNEYATVLAKEKTVIMGMEAIVLECKGEIPHTLLYEFDTNTLLIDYVIYEVPNSHEKQKEM